jgi:hypothetical protein
MQDLGQPEEALKTWRELMGINPDFVLPSGQRLKDMLDSLQKK